MTWSDFYLICFAAGFFLSLVSVLGAGLHLSHLPHLHFDHGGDLPHGDAGDGGHGGEVSPINFGTITAFLAWFGGAGYLLTRHSSLWFVLVLAISGVCGLAGATLVFLFLAKVLVKKDENLDPADYEMVGVLGRITSVIRAGGTGEIVFTQGGTRHCAGARSEDATAIPKGTEVIVTRYEKGIAYVRRWDEMTGSGLE